MRNAIFVLAIAGIIVSGLSLRVHYTNETQPYSSGARQDCSVVTHSPYATIGVVPVEAIGVVGYLLLALLTGFRRRWWTFLGAWAGLGFAAYLSYIEAFVLGTWCAYCVVSQCVIALIAILATIDVVRALLKRLGLATNAVDTAIKTLRYG